MQAKRVSRQNYSHNERQLENIKWASALPCYFMIHHSLAAPASPSLNVFEVTHRDPVCAAAALNAPTHDLHRPSMLPHSKFEVRHTPDC